MTQVILIRGLPGSGKSTLAQEYIQKHPSARHIESDMYFLDNGIYKFNPRELKDAHAWCFKEYHRSLVSIYPPELIVVSNTFTQRWEIQPYIALANLYGCNISIIEPDTSWKNDINELRFKNTHGVPTSTLMRMQDRWESTERNWI